MLEKPLYAALKRPILSRFPLKYNPFFIVSSNPYSRGLPGFWKRLYFWGL